MIRDLQPHLLGRNIACAIGRTPLVPLRRASHSTGAMLVAKLEGANPGGSVKDRAALFMLERAEREGLLESGGAIVEATSGNTGIGLAVVARSRGYSLTVTMPASASVERRLLLAALGAGVVPTPAEDGMAGAVMEARRIAAETGAFVPDQFANRANAEAHFRTTGPEIWEGSGARVGAVVCGVGTGGTITGVGEFLKQRSEQVAIVAVEPAASAILGGGKAGSHAIEGLGAGFVPALLNREVIDMVLAIGDEEARLAARRLAREEGIMAGISSGAAFAAALRLAARPESRGRMIVFVCPDRGDRYLSTGLWADETGAGENIRTAPPGAG